MSRKRIGYKIILLVGYICFTATRGCEPPWKYYQGSCYYFPTSPKSRQEAADFCASSGGALAIVSSLEESYFITMQTKEDAVIDEYYYVQGDDMNTEGTFLYDDNTFVEYIEWKAGAPDNNDNQDCLVMDFEISPGEFQERKQMNDKDCGVPYYFLCKKTDAGLCGANWVTYNGSCYYFSTIMKTYPDSVSHCVTLEASIAKISSLEENEFVSFARSDTWDKKYWIQGNDMLTENTFVYEDGTPMSFVDWAATEPNDYDGQDCVRLNPLPRRKMNDKSCEFLSLYVCEKPGSRYVAVKKETLPGKYSVGRCALRCNADSMCTAFSIGPNNECYPLTTSCTDENICYKRV